MAFNPTPFEPSSPASFTPTQGTYKPLTPFRYWCQKVLPLVYDDSLSYYELLCKVVDYLNKTMEDVDTLHTDVDNLHDAYDLLQADMNNKYTAMTSWMNNSYSALVSYVNNYFANLDVQQEINNKLDAMALDGTLATLMQPYIPAAVAADIDSMVLSGEFANIVSPFVQPAVNTKVNAMAQDGSLKLITDPKVVEETDSWLNSHITNPSNPPLDTSLSLSNAAAPADLTGNIKNVSDNCMNWIGLPLSNGYLTKADIFTSDSNFRVTDYIMCNGINQLTLYNVASANGYIGAIHYYNEEKHFLKYDLNNSGSSVAGITTNVPKDAYYFRLNLNATDANKFKIEYSSNPLTGIPLNIKNNTSKMYELYNYKRTGYYYNGQGGFNADSNQGYRLCYVKGLESIDIDCYYQGGAVFGVTFVSNNLSLISRLYQGSGSELSHRIETVPVPDTAVYAIIPFYTGYDSHAYIKCDKVPIGIELKPIEIANKLMTWQGNYVSFDNYSVLTLNVNAGEKYVIENQFNGTIIYSAMIFNNANTVTDFILQGADEARTASGILVMPTGATKMIINTYNSFVRVVKIEETNGNNIIDNALMKPLAGKKVAIYGDSWVDSSLDYHVWCDYFEEYTGATVHSLGTAGATLATIVSNFDNEVADIYVFESGINDWNQNQKTSQVKQAVLDAISAVQSVAPNAEIYFTTIPSQIQINPSVSGRVIYYSGEIYRQTIWQTAIKNGAKVIDGLKLSNITLTNDGLHPKDARSCRKIAKWVEQGIVNGGDVRQSIKEIREIPSEGFLIVEGSNTSYLFYGRLVFTNGVATYPSFFTTGDTAKIVPNSCLLDIDGSIVPVRCKLNSSGMIFEATDTTLNVTVANNQSNPAEIKFVLTGLA